MLFIARYRKAYGAGFRAGMSGNALEAKNPYTHLRGWFWQEGRNNGLRKSLERHLLRRRLNKLMSNVV